ncbi:acyltransferase [Pseudoalteromonas sp. 1_2015MBL_MicDiv]|uniref:acyltransferase n=1 Tax=Pseudoalteromonas sp. 1_2015MBL_MicDiv TaxID=1720343 RepID=UPI000BBF37FC|nr:acyltransferase [Pseudoalteromonas sp. 1_2015MBL_MicDiv]ATG76500.1 acetyltransferase [Pseudoalteromonas sp. 1_2015MBL_MicDiv]
MLNKFIFWLKCERLGPDIPLTHFLLHSRRLGRWLCKKKFHSFEEGSFFRPGAYAVESKKISIGKNVIIRPQSMLFASPNSEEIQIVIEDYVLVGSGVHLYVSNHEFRDKTRPIYFQGHTDIQSVYIKKGAWIGANSVILPGVVVGENSIVAAGSIVTKNVEAFTVVAGNPAKMIKRL